MSSDPSSRALDTTARVLVVASLALFGGFLHFNWPFTVDDSFISFRYAENLVEGIGLTYNRGEAPVEGYTTFLWVVVMAIPHAIGLDVVLFSKLAGVASVLLLFRVSWCFVKRLTAEAHPSDGRVGAAIVVFMLVCGHTTAVHAVSGMETAMYAFFLQSFFYLMLVVHDDEGPWTLRLLPTTGLLVGLTRPEGNIAVAIGLVGLFVALPATRRLALVRSSVVFLVVPGALYFAWRYGYYGVLFPLPFYVTGHFGTARAGTEVVLEFLGHIALGFTVFLPLGLYGLRGAGSRAWPALVATAVFMVFYTMPVHRMAYGYRYLFPVLPMLSVVAAVGVVTALGWLRERQRDVGTARLLAMAGLAVSVVGTGFLWEVIHYELGGGPNLSRYYADVLERNHIALGLRLRGLRKNGERPTLALPDAGAVPYYSQWNVVDTVGLNDRHIALSGEHTPEYILGRDPDLVIFNSQKRAYLEPRLPWDRALYDACLAKGMKPLKVIGPGFYALHILGYPDTPIARSLQTWRRMPKGGGKPKGFDRSF